MIALKISNFLYLLGIICSLGSSFQSAAQSQRPSRNEKGSNTVHMLSAVDHDTCLNKQFSVVFYIVQDSTQNKNIASIQTNQIAKLMNILNTEFRRICVSFQQCSTVVIPNYEYNKWYSQTDKVVGDNWYTENTINIYLVEDLKEVPAEESAGYAHALFVPGAMHTNRDMMVFQYTTIAPDKKPHAFVSNAASYFGSTIAHVAGHFFGLPDTFSELLPPAGPGTNELVRRNNCAIAGDGFCDTEADPYPQNYFEFFPPPGTYCNYYPARRDAQGDYFTPPVDNLMSMYGCRCRFTQEQYNHMARYIVKHRMHLH